MKLKRVDMHDGTTAIVNTAQVLWLGARDPRTTRIHFSGTTPISVKGSVAEVARQLSPGL